MRIKQLQESNFYMSSNGYWSVYTFEGKNEKARIIIDCTKNDYNDNKPVSAIIDVYGFNDSYVIKVTSLEYTLIPNVYLVQDNTNPTQKDVCIEINNSPISINATKIYGSGDLTHILVSSPIPYPNVRYLYSDGFDIITGDAFFYRFDDGSINVFKQYTSHQYTYFETNRGFRFDSDSALGDAMLTVWGQVKIGPNGFDWNLNDSSPLEDGTLKIATIYEHQGITFTGDTAGSYAPAIKAWDQESLDYDGYIEFFYGVLRLTSTSSTEFYTGTRSFTPSTTDLYLKLDSTNSKVYVYKDLEVSDNVLISGDLNVGGQVTFNSTLTVQAAVSLQSTLDVGGVSNFAGTVYVNNNFNVLYDTSLGGDLSVNGNLSVGGTKNATVPSIRNSTDIQKRIPSAALEMPFASGMYFIMSNVDVYNGKSIKIPDVFLDSIDKDTISIIIQPIKELCNIAYELSNDRQSFLVYTNCGTDLKVNIFIWARRWDNEFVEDLGKEMYEQLGVI